MWGTVDPCRIRFTSGSLLDSQEGHVTGLGNWLDSGFLIDDEGLELMTGPWIEGGSQLDRVRGGNKVIKCLDFRMRRT